MSARFSNVRGMMADCYDAAATFRVGLVVRIGERKKRRAAPAAGMRRPARRPWKWVEKTPVSQGRVAPPKDAVAKSAPRRAWLPVRARRKDRMRG